MALRVSRMWTFLAILLAAVVGFLSLMWIFQRKMIYLPLTHDVPPAAAVLAGAEEISFRAGDGLRLAGWFVPAAGGRTAGTVLVFNGNAGNRFFRASLAETLRAADLNVLLFDYRGYGGNPGRPTEAGLAADARGALEYLLSRDDVDPERLIYLGESLGSGVAVELAVERPPAAIVLRSPFTSLPDVGRVHFPFLPVRLMLRDRFPSIDRVGRLSCPLLVIAGDRDTIVPSELSERLYEAANEPKRLIVIPGADHNDPDFGNGIQWLDGMVDFLQDAGVLGAR